MSSSADGIDAAALGSCPLPQTEYDRILLGHGSGGGLTAELIQRPPARPSHCWNSRPSMH